MIIIVMATLKEWKRDFNKLPKWEKFSIVIGIIGLIYVGGSYVQNNYQNSVTNSSLNQSPLCVGQNCTQNTIYNINQETTFHNNSPSLSIVEYTVEDNGINYLTPTFIFKNVGKVPLEYYVNKSDITRISFYENSNKIFELNAGQQIKTTDFVYHNRGEIIFPEAVSSFSFTPTELQRFQVSHTHFEMDIRLEINYWNVEIPSKYCIFYSKYTLYLNENKIYPISQNLSCI